MLTAPVAAQDLFAEIEAALSGLEARAGATPEPAPVQPVPEAVVEFAPTAPPAELLSPDLTRARDDFVFLPLLTDQACPTQLAEVGAQAESLTEQANSYEVVALELSERFVRLEEQNRAMVADETQVRCPNAFVREAEEFRSDLSRLDLSELVQRADTFSACAQSGLVTLNARMESLAQSSDPNAATDRQAIGGVLRRWAVMDVQVSQAISNLVFFEQRGRRFDTATSAFLRRCEVFEDAGQLEQYQ